MLRVSELSETAQSFQTASRSSSFLINRWGLRSRKSRTRKAFGSTGNSSPALTMENSRSRTSTSAKVKTKHLCSVMNSSHPSGNDQEPVMTMQRHAPRVHPANPAEVIANVAYQVPSVHQFRRHNP